MKQPLFYYTYLHDDYSYDRNAFDNWHSRQDLNSVGHQGSLVAAGRFAVVQEDPAEMQKERQVSLKMLIFSLYLHEYSREL